MSSECDLGGDLRKIAGTEMRWSYYGNSLVVLDGQAVLWPAQSLPIIPQLPGTPHWLWPKMAISLGPVTMDARYLLDTWP